ncbi:type II toxin-antitoxin system RatA family toxin [Luteibacter anthropi]|uniref:Type II toxin-antitoxin system RatA family toxin n=1 Tax=Luteibacter anthropi TaxID=564369 RepID=A0A7X5ZHP9_9GAMM|nr:type II toxin-antitoxin system RatA family toxin [Luteibacter anthropi]NII05825.1 type II toxin-antitoxin system RatA family toxin [Luteibacter anthropi]URX62036.1 type II toxin-antitoxin system RatA family toxin [Luteibacter anthropi]
MIEIRRSAIVPFTPAQMFDLVNDVEAYPKRFGWCDAATVIEREDDKVLLARLDLKFAGMKQNFTTRNTMERPERLTMKFVEGPLRSLDGVFSFQPLGDLGCKISLELDFDYAGLGGSVLKLGFQQLANRMVDDFCEEARRQYG